MNIFLELTSIVLLVTIMSITMRFLKQPLVIGYILAGILASPFFFDLIHAKENIELFSRIGIIVLLFIVGLNLNPKVVKEMRKTSLVAGLGQIVATATLSFFVSMILGMSLFSSVYIAIALTFSSTIIIMKLLSDRADLNKVYGKITIGILLVQDLVAILILMIVSSFAGVADTDPLLLTVLIVLKGAVTLFVLYLLARYVFPKFSHFIVASSELMLLFSLAWALGLATVFYLLGFSIESGALLAGVTLSVSPFADGIASRLKPLRDFFIVLFFILLGSEMKLDTIGEIILPAILLSLFVLLIKPLVVFALMHVLGYKRKTAFQTGLALTQISEFSLILITLAFTLGHIGATVMSLVTLVGIITIAGSAYLIVYSDSIYHRIGSYLKVFEFGTAKKEKAVEEDSYEIVLFGFDRVGHDFIHAFSKLEKKYVIVDMNPSLIRQMQEAQIPFKFGDAEDVEFLDELHLEKVTMVVSTIPDFKTNLLLLKKTRSVNPQAIVIVLTHDISSAKELYESGASYVIMPHYLGARHASDIIRRLNFDQKEFEKEREKHLADIHKRES